MTSKVLQLWTYEEIIFNILELEFQNIKTLNGSKIRIFNKSGACFTKHLKPKIFVSPYESLRLKMLSETGTRFAL